MAGKGQGGDEKGGESNGGGVRRVMLVHFHGKRLGDGGGEIASFFRVTGVSSLLALGQKYVLNYNIQVGVPEASRFAK